MYSTLQALISLVQDNKAILRSDLNWTTDMIICITKWMKDSMTDMFNECYENRQTRMERLMENCLLLYNIYLYILEFQIVVDNSNILLQVS